MLFILHNNVVLSLFLCIFYYILHAYFCILYTYFLHILYTFYTLFSIFLVIFCHLYANITHFRAFFSSFFYIFCSFFYTFTQILYTLLCTSAQFSRLASYHFLCICTNFFYALYEIVLAKRHSLYKPFGIFAQNSVQLTAALFSSLRKSLQ